MAKLEIQSDSAVQPDLRIRQLSANVKIGTEKINKPLAEEIDFVPWRQTPASVSSTKSPDVAIGDRWNFLNGRDRSGRSQLSIFIVLSKIIYVVYQDVGELFGRPRRWACVSRGSSAD
jgi:hypothetical protein